MQREHIYTKTNPTTRMAGRWTSAKSSGLWIYNLDELDELDTTVETDKKESLTTQPPDAGKRKR